MPYEYLDDVATADAAFRAWGATVGEMFVAAADAVMGVMVGELGTIAAAERREIVLHDEAMDMLLFGFLGELLYYKDAEQLLLRVGEVEVMAEEGGFVLRTDARGERIDAGRHELVVDVKAVTLHRFEVGRTERGWEAMVVVDV